MTDVLQRIDKDTLALIQSFSEQFGCSFDVALQFLLKTGRNPQEPGEDDESYAARIQSLPDPLILDYRAFAPANDH